MVWGTWPPALVFVVVPLPMLLVVLLWGQLSGLRWFAMWCWRVCQGFALSGPCLQGGWGGSRCGRWGQHCGFVEAVRGDGDIEHIR